MGFAQNLDHLMQSRGMTKYQLAKELVCHQTSVTNWLENGTVPQKRTLGAIANLFNISVEALCSDDLPDFEQKEKHSTDGEVLKALTPDHYEEFLSSLTLEEIKALYEKMGEEMAKRIGK